MKIDRDRKKIIINPFDILLIIIVITLIVKFLFFKDSKTEIDLPKVDYSISENERYEQSLNKIY